MVSGGVNGGGAGAIVLEGNDAQLTEERCWGSSMAIHWGIKGTRFGIPT